MNKNVKCIPFPGVENAYIIISAHKSDTGNKVKKCMTFFYHNEDIGADWEPDYGPITRIHKCGKEHPGAEKHWFFDYCTGYGSWSQLAVDECNLANAFINGDYNHIFNILRSFAC